MSSSLYFKNRVTIENIEDAIVDAFGDINVRTFNSGRFGESRYCTFIFNYDGIDYTINFCSHNYISGGVRNGTNPDTLSGSVSNDSLEIMRKIASYFGGELLEDDTDEDNFITIQLTNDKIVSKRSVVLNLLLSNGYDEISANNTLELMLENKDLFLNFLSSTINR